MTLCKEYGSHVKDWVVARIPYQARGSPGAALCRPVMVNQIANKIETTVYRGMMYRATD